MEPHPVPQNIIDVEFKLFGSFSLRQFGQILIGCMVAVIVYFIPIIPFIIKVPVILIAVVSGLLSAVIPSFGTWMLGFAKALIVDPRYVWVKEPARSDILEQSKTHQTTKATTNSDDTKIDRLEAFAIADAVEEKDDILEDFLVGDKSPDKNQFDSLYGKVFVDAKPKPQVQAGGNVTDTPASKIVNETPKFGQAQASSIETKESQPKVEEKPVDIEDHVVEEKKLITKEDIAKQIEGLRLQLNQYSKESDKDKGMEIMNKINDLYSQYKLMKNEEPKVVVAGSKQVQAFSKQTTGGKIIFGIVVSKSEKPIADAEITLTNFETKEVFTGKSSSDGKFSTANKLPFGKYDVQIFHPSVKFHTYRVDVVDSRLPAFKFREK